MPYPLYVQSRLEQTFYLYFEKFLKKDRLHPNANVSTLCHAMPLPSIIVSSIPNARSSIPDTRLRILRRQRRRQMLPILTLAPSSPAIPPAPLWLLWRGAPSPAILHHWGTRLGFSYAGGAPAATDDAAEDAEEEEAADAAGDANDEVTVVVDPGADFFCYGGAFALALLCVSVIHEGGFGRGVVMR